MQVVYTYKIQYVKTVCLYISVFILIGCAKADIMYSAVADAQGLVVIHPDQSTYRLPALQYHFYNTNNEYITRACDGRGNFEGVIPVGAYRVIATNMGANNVYFTGMDDYATAAVATQVTRVQDYISQPGEVYSIVTDELVVSEVDSFRYTPLPVLLTRVLTLNFTLSDELQQEVTALSGVLPGVYPSVYLYDGKTLDTEVKRSPDVFTTYTGVRSDAGWVASIRLFGLCDPQYGVVYRNVTTICLTMGNVPYTLDVDLTTAISSVMEAYSGKLPIDVPIQLHIELKHVDLEVVGCVESWSYTGNDGTEILIPV